MFNLSQHEPVAKITHPIHGFWIKIKWLPQEKLEKLTSEKEKEFEENPQIIEVFIHVLQDRLVNWGGISLDGKKELKCTPQNIRKVYQKWPDIGNWMLGSAQLMQNFVADPNEFKKKLEASGSTSTNGASQEGNQLTVANA